MRPARVPKDVLEDDGADRGIVFFGLQAQLARQLARAAVRVVVPLTSRGVTWENHRQQSGRQGRARESA